MNFFSIKYTSTEISMYYIHRKRRISPSSVISARRPLGRRDDIPRVRSSSSSFLSYLGFFARTLSPSVAHISQGVLRTHVRRSGCRPGGTDLQVKWHKREECCSRAWHSFVSHPLRHDFSFFFSLREDLARECARAACLSLYFSSES